MYSVTKPTSRNAFIIFLRRLQAVVKTRGNRFYQMVYIVIKILSRRSGVSYAEVLKRFSHAVDADLETSLTRSPIVLCTDMKRSCVHIPHLTTYIFNTLGKRPNEVFRDLLTT